MNPLTDIPAPILAAAAAGAIGAGYGRAYRSPGERLAEAISAIAWTAAAVLASGAFAAPLAQLLAAALLGHEALRRSWHVTVCLRGTVGRHRLTGVSVSMPDGRTFPAGLYYDEATGRWAQPGDTVAIEVRQSWLFGSVLGTRLAP